MQSEIEEGSASNWLRYKQWILEHHSQLHIAHLAFAYRRKLPWIMASLPIMESDPDWEKVFPLLLAWALANSD